MKHWRISTSINDAVRNRGHPQWLQQPSVDRPHGTQQWNSSDLQWLSKDWMATISFSQIVKGYLRRIASAILAGDIQRLSQIFCGWVWHKAIVKVLEQSRKDWWPTSQPAAATEQPTNQTNQTTKPNCHMIPPLSAFHGALSTELLEITSHLSREAAISWTRSECLHKICMERYRFRLESNLYTYRPSMERWRFQWPIVWNLHLLLFLQFL